jgi:hypothetical protein
MFWTAMPVRVEIFNLGTELEPPAHTLREGQQQQIIHLNGHAAWTPANNFMQKCDPLLPATMIFQRGWVLLLAMAAIILGSKFWLISVFGSPTPFEDQWDAEAAWLFKPYVEGTLRIGDLLAPHNEHRCLWTRLLDLALLELNGRWGPIIEMTVNALVHVAALAALVAMLGATLGRADRVVLAATTAFLFALPFGLSNTLVGGFHSAFYFLPLFSFACFHFGVDAPAFSARWWGAIAFGVGAYFATSSGALTLAPLVLVHGVQALLRRRTGWREYAAIALCIALVVLMVSAIPTMDYNAPLSAHSLSQFASAFFVAMAWPLSALARLQPRAGWDLLPNLATAVLVNIPVISFVWNRARWLDPGDRTAWIYLLVGLWTATQAAALAYGRAVSVLDSRYLDLLAINVVLNVACVLSLVHGNAGFPVRCAATTWVAAIVLIVTALALIRLPREALDWWHHTQEQTINISGFLATGDSAHLTDKPFRAIPYGSAERLGQLASDLSIRSILPEDIMPTAEAHTRNSKLLLGGPLHGLFHALRSSLTLLGLFCLTAGLLIFVYAGYVLHFRQFRRAAASLTDIRLR